MLPETAPSLIVKLSSDWSITSNENINSLVTTKVSPYVVPLNSTPPPRRTYGTSKQPTLMKYYTTTGARQSSTNIP